MELLMQKRQALHEGYVLEPDGGTFGQAIRTRDISIPSYREELTRLNRHMLTQANGNSRVAELRATPPDLELCDWVVREMAERRPAFLQSIDEEIKSDKDEIKDTALGRDERAYLRLRVKQLEKVRQLVVEEADITASQLHEWFVKEDLQLRARMVPPEIRQSLEILTEERAAGFV